MTDWWKAEHYSEWRLLRRRTYTLCVMDHGAELLDRLCALPETAGQSEVEKTVGAWLQEGVLKEVENRARGQPIPEENEPGEEPENEYARAGANRGDAAQRWREVGNLLSQETLHRGLSRRLDQKTRRQLRALWPWREPKAREQAYSILGNIVKQFLHEARTEGALPAEICLKLWKAAQHLKQEAEHRAGTEGLSHYARYRLTREFDKPEFLTEALLAYFQSETARGKPRDVDTPEKMLARIYECFPEIGLKIVEIEADLFEAHLPELNPEWEDFQRCLGRMPARQKQAVEIKLEQEMTGETDAEIARRYQISRETLRHHFNQARPALLDCMGRREEYKQWKKPTP